ncbi:MAG: signal peptidase [Frankiaceae bacterium]|jgi:signal peptidase|nr:signal peptidase [Frankiaceae bacterium]
MQLPAAVRTTLVITVCLLAALALAAVAAVRTDRVRCLRVLTGSMSPTVPAGSLVAGTRISAAGVRVGDIVMFVPPPPYRAPGGDPIAHRIVRIASRHGDRYLTTKGDANPVADPWLIDAKHSTLYRVQWHSATAGTALGAAHKWGPASAAGLLVVPAWLAGMRRLNRGTKGRHRSSGRRHAGMAL